MIQNEGRDRDTDRTIGQDGGTERMTQNAMGYRKEDKQDGMGVQKGGQQDRMGVQKGEQQDGMGIKKGQEDEMRI